MLQRGTKSRLSCGKKSGVKIITGPPGSGKTAIIKGLIAAYKSENKKGIVELSATTGAAAQVIKKVVEKMDKPCINY